MEESAMPPTLDRLVSLVRSEFAEMPGLSLTERQAARLWQVPAADAALALAALVDARFLARSVSGRYVRPSAV
jgi:hypothetical protein